MPVRHGRSQLFVYLLVCVAVAVGGWFGVSWLLTPRVEVVRQADGPVVQAFYATGVIAPDRDYLVRSAAAGILTRVLVDKNTTVKAGDVLAEVTDSNLVYQLKKAQAELAEKRRRVDSGSPVLAEFDAKAKAFGEMVAIARREEYRLGKLVETSAASSVDVDQAADRVQQVVAQYESIVAQRAAKELELKREVDVAEAAVATAQWEVDQQQLRAPIDGTVLDRPTAQGTRVAVNDTVLRIADVRPERLVMRAAVDEEDLTNVNEGQVVRMSLYSFPGQPISGRVLRVYSEADKDRRTFEVDVMFDEPRPGFRPGMTGELAFVIAEKLSARVVPAQAYQGGRIWVIRDGKLQGPDVTIGLRSVERVEVLSGLEPNDMVLVSPLGTMTEGQRVRTKEVDARKKASELTPATQSGQPMKFG